MMGLGGQRRPRRPRRRPDVSFAVLLHISAHLSRAHALFALTSILLCVLPASCTCVLHSPVW